VSIPEEMITQHLNQLLTSSDPGDIMHHLYVVAAPVSAVGPFGLADPEKLKVAVYAIAPVGPDINPIEFVRTAIVASLGEHARRGERPLFAALSQESWYVDREELDDDADQLAEQLLRERRLHEHPDAAEVTTVYGVCADGRRWRGRRYLTGAKAGQDATIETLVGRPRRDEADGMPYVPAMCRLVGIKP